MFKYWILFPPRNGESVIDEVTQFYGAKGIVPRFYIYDTDDKSQFIQELERHGFKVEKFVDPVQLWTGEVVAVKESHDVTIENVTAENFEDAAKIECSTTEFGGEEVQRKAFEQEFRNSNFQHLWVFPITEENERVYQKCGFITVGKLTNGHAYMSGTGIHEIRQEAKRG